MTWRTSAGAALSNGGGCVRAAGTGGSPLVADSMLTDWVLTGSVAWHKAQELHVAIQFGSSG